MPNTASSGGGGIREAVKRRDGDHTVVENNDGKRMPDKEGSPQQNLLDMSGCSPVSPHINGHSNCSSVSDLPIADAKERPRHLQ